MNRLRFFPIKPDDYTVLNDIRKLPSPTTLVLVIIIFILIQPILPNLRQLSSPTETATNPGNSLIAMGLSTLVLVVLGLFGAAIISGVACKTFLSYPKRFIQKHELRLLTGDHLAYRTTQRISTLLNISHPIKIFEAVENQTDTQVFGTFRKQYLVISKKHIKLFENDPNSADLLICHELAHLQSGDHWKWSFTRHIITSSITLWLIFTISGVIIIDEIWIGSPIQQVENLLPAVLIVLLQILLYLCTILIKNIREAYADHLTSEVLHLSHADIVVLRARIAEQTLGLGGRQVPLRELLENAIARFLYRSKIFKSFSIRLQKREKLVSSSESLVFLIGLLTGASTFNFGGAIDSIILLLPFYISIAVISILVHSLYYQYADQTRQGISISKLWRWFILFFGGATFCAALYTILRLAFEWYFDFPTLVVNVAIFLSLAPSILFLLCIPLLILPTMVAVKMVNQSIVILNSDLPRWRRFLVVIGVPALVSIGIFLLSISAIYGIALVLRNLLMLQAESSFSQITYVNPWVIILLLSTVVMLTVLYSTIFQQFAREE